MMSNARWLIYGGGQTGTRIAEEAVRRGHRPLLVGRSAAQLKPLAERLGLEWATASLTDPEALSRVVSTVDLVLHTAGPATSTSAPMLRACLTHHTHYLDLANEIPVFQSVHAHDHEARERDIALISGVGFGVVATNCLVQHVAAQVPDAKELQIALHPYTDGTSPNANQSRLAVLAYGGRIRRNGHLLT